MNFKFISFVKIVLFAFILFNETSGQSSSENQFSDQRIGQLQSVTPPTPNAASLGKYGDLPVSLYTGLVNISVPLYEIKNKSLNIPVNISYHSAGIKTGEVASSVGLGWALNAGGLITRSVRGLPDDDPSGYLETRNKFNDPGNALSGYVNTYAFYGTNYTTDEYLRIESAKGNIDLEPDYFILNALGRSYKLFFKGNNEIVTQPYSNLKITADFFNKTWTVLLEDGTKLIFGTSDDYVERNICNCFGDNYGYANFISAWMLKSVIGVSGETINFTYLQSGYREVSSFSQTDYKALNPYNTDFKQPKSRYDLTDGIVKNIASIESPSVRIDFTYKSDTRQDLPGGKAVDNVKIYSKIENLFIKNFNFQYNYSQAPYTTYRYGINENAFYYRLKLQSITESAYDGSNPKTWGFEYNTQNLPHRYSFAQDYWGYYNGQDGNQSLSPYVAGFTTFPSANREADEQKMQAEILTKINFPTGGSTLFEYEGNKIPISGSTTKLMGGLRIKSITDYDGINTNPSTKRFFEYAQEFTISDLSDINNYLTDVEQAIWQPNGAGIPYMSQTWQYKVRSANPRFALGSVQGGTIGYGMVTTKVKDVEGTGGKIVNEFRHANDINTDEAKELPYPPITSVDWRRGLQLRETVYNASGQMLKKTENQYEFGTRNKITSFKSAFSKENVGEYFSFYVGLGYSIVKRTYFDIITEDVKSVQTTQTTYGTNGQAATSTTNNYYDNSLLVSPTRSTIINSKGETITNINRTALDKAAINYSYGLTSSASDAIDAMVAKNMVSQVLEQEKILGSTPISWSRLNYKTFPTGLLLPENSYVRKGGNSPDKLIEFSNYDGIGNLLEQRKTNDVLQSYIYDYQKELPIAQATNASFSSIAYTSFEADGKGNWDYAGSINYSEGITGNKSYYLSTGNIERTALNAATTYTITYWVKNGSGYVSLGGNVILNKNGWTLYETSITGITALTISGSAIIDELRMYPKGAQMTTYTYLPLIGISSQADLNNRITYYEYDGFNRLKLIRDMDKNIIKKFDYQYQQPQY